MTHLEDFPSALRRAMRTHRPPMTQDALSAKAKVAQGYISELSRGIKRPGAHVLTRLAVALGKSPGYFNRFLLVSSSDKTIGANVPTSER